MVTIKVLEGKDLMPGDANGLSDPYCIVGLAGSDGEFISQASCVRSETKRWTLSPAWKTAVLELKQAQSDKVRVEVWGKDHEKPTDAFMGLVIFEVDTSQKLTEKWLSLKSRKEGEPVKGQVRIVISCNTTGPATTNAPAKSPVLPKQTSQNPIEPTLVPELSATIAPTSSAPTSSAPAPITVTDTAPIPVASAPVSEPVTVPVTNTPANASTTTKARSASNAPAQHAPSAPQVSAPVQVPAPAPAANAPNAQSGSTKKHVMISYNWGSQTLAKQLFKKLTTKGYVVWMDVEGGMRGDIYQAMAEGVEGAAVFVPLLTKKYRDSPNCRRECTTAVGAAIPCLPLMCENFKEVLNGWLNICLGSLLWYKAFSDTEANTFPDEKIWEGFLADLDKVIPNDSPARKPNLSLYICFAPKNKDIADWLKKSLEHGKDVKYECFLSADKAIGLEAAKPQLGNKPKQETDNALEEPKPGSSDEPQGPVRPIKVDGLDNKAPAITTPREGKFKNAQEKETRLRDAKAVIMILTPEFEHSDDCKNDVNLSYSYRKVIIPLVCKPLTNGYPPKDMQFALQSVNSLDFAQVLTSKRQPVMLRQLKQALEEGVVSVSGNQTRVLTGNFRIKVVGKWSETDVADWLKYIGLSQHEEQFKKKHVNGRVLLSLLETDLDQLIPMKLHQRKFFAAISELFTGLTWNNEEVAEWLDTVGLPEIRQLLYGSNLDGQSLLMLTSSDLKGSNILDPITQVRILLEIQQLKESVAKVPSPNELYRFKMLREVLAAVPPDEVDKNSKFSAVIIDLLRLLYDGINENGQGLTQTKLKKFLFIILLLANLYHDTYPAKILWTDANVVEVLSLKVYANHMIEAIDELVTAIDKVLVGYTTKGRDSAETVQLRLEFEQQNANFLYTYVILNNILQRLFSIIDRQVDGVVSWSELLPALELIVYGTIEDKIKLGLALVDFNGDGVLSENEYKEFYKECFLPLVHMCKRVKFVEDFEKLDKSSFLYVAFSVVKDMIPEESLMLNTKFRVKSISGDPLIDPSDGEDTVLSPPFAHIPYIVGPYGYHEHPLTAVQNPYLNTFPGGKGFSCNGCHEGFNDDTAWHCDKCNFDLCEACNKKKENATEVQSVDIVMKLASGELFTLTNICIGGMFYASAPCLVKNALVWVHEKKIDIESYTHNFDKFDLRKFKALPPNAPNKPHLFLTTNKEDNFMAYADLGTSGFLSGKYLHIKLLDSHKEEDVPDTEWNGFWQQGDNKGAMKCILGLGTDCSITGGGKDEIGVFRWQGSWDPEKGTVEMVKQYLGRHSVLYKGTWDAGLHMHGQWSIGNFDSGNFELHKASEVQKPVSEEKQVTEDTETAEDAHESGSQHSEEGEGEDEDHDGHSGSDEGGDADSDFDKVVFPPAELARKSLTAEFIGLWGYVGKVERKDTHKTESTKELFTAFQNECEYGSYGNSKQARRNNEENDSNSPKINEDVDAFLMAARDIVNGAEDVAVPHGNRKMVDELIGKLSFLEQHGANPADTLKNILPIVHLLRLFYGYNYETILTKPV